MRGSSTGRRAGCRSPKPDRRSSSAACSCSPTSRRPSSRGRGGVDAARHAALTCPSTFGSAPLAPAIAAFVAAIRRCASTSSSPTASSTSSTKGFDLAVRIGADRQPESSSRGAIGTTRDRLLRGAVVPRPPRRAARARRPRAARVPHLRIFGRAATCGVSRSDDGARAQRAHRAARCTRTTASLNDALAARRRGHRARARLHRRRPTCARAAWCRSCGLEPPPSMHLRRVPEPAAPVGEGARVRRFPGRSALGRGRESDPVRRSGRARVATASSGCRRMYERTYEQYGATRRPFAFA